MSVSSSFWDKYNPRAWKKGMAWHGGGGKEWGTAGAPSRRSQSRLQEQGLHRGVGSRAGAWVPLGKKYSGSLGVCAGDSGLCHEALGNT